MLLKRAGWGGYFQTKPLKPILMLLKLKTILWNGPMGVFEMSSLKTELKQVALSYCRRQLKKALFVSGGGDSVAAINKYNWRTSKLCKYWQRKLY